MPDSQQSPLMSQKVLQQVPPLQPTFGAGQQLPWPSQKPAQQTPPLQVTFGEAQQLPSDPHSPSQQPSAQQCWASAQHSSPQANCSAGQHTLAVVQLMLKQQPLPPQHL
jgi:hypothetical protein